MKTLKPYQHHGVDLDLVEGAEDIVGTCPFCNKEKKFSVNVQTGQWRCFVCGSGSTKGGGNEYTFIRLLWEQSCKGTTARQYQDLADSRGILSGETVKAWGCCISSITHEWLVPGFGVDGKLNQLSRYVKTKEGYKLLATPNLTQQLHGVPSEWNSPRSEIHYCEGPWDGMAWWEALGNTKYVDAFSFTGSENGSLRADTVVVAVPGCQSFNPRWGELAAGKQAVFLYDSDHPRVQNGKTFIAGMDGVKRATQILAVESETKPKQICWLQWGDKGYDEEKQSGWDLRDELRQGKTIKERVDLVGSVWGRVAVIPDEWIPARSALAKRTGGADIAPESCTSWKALQNSWKKAMKWTAGLEHALAAMLASIVSTKGIGDQLWLKVIGPASCGKSTLCEAISVAKKYVVAKSTIRGFHSGYDTTGKGEEDNSLLSIMDGKTLVTKDGDTLLQSPNLPQILSEARDVYDRTSRTHYRNKTSKDYEGVSMTWLLCGTSSLRQLDSSELGERFLDVVIMEGIDDELEDEVLWRVANRVSRNRAVEVDSREQHDPDLIHAMQMTGGYVNYLRENASDLLEGVENTEEQLRLCIAYGKFVAHMRARPSKKQDESAEREFSARLVSQLLRLANCLAVVLGKKSLDEDVLKRVRQVAFDTARGRTLELVKHLYDAGEEGTTSASLSILTGQTADKERTLLHFLKRIKVVELYTGEKEEGQPAPKPKWRLTARATKMYEAVK